MLEESIGLLPLKGKKFKTKNRDLEFSFRPNTKNENLKSYSPAMLLPD